MHIITKNIGISHFDRNIDLTTKDEIKRILICRPNHRLGNLLLITPLLQEITATFPQCKIDLFVKGNIAPVIFKNYENVQQIIQLPRKPFKDITEYIKTWITIRKHRYDIAINADKNSSSGRLSTLFANSKYKFFGEDIQKLQSKYNDYKHIAKNPIYNFRYYLSEIGFTAYDKPIASLDLKLSPSEIAEGKKRLEEIVNNGKKTICLFTYATGDKCYSESWWEKFYEILTAIYSDYNIVEVLPVENISRISFKAPSFYSKDIREIGSLIANTEIFIGADSGIMHLASSSQITTIGLFSITDPNIYQPYNNNSLAITTTNSNTDEWIEILNGILKNTSKNL
ncbi:MAG: glycosyltransferase family 9 protein [Bacteroidota bacterium]|nr:glycosyltransferase family 9 protein [Bacteroidota bacterium]